MSGGAVVAAAAAAHQRRVRVILDAFRLADATAPERARSLDQLGVVPHAEVDELTRAGVLCPGPHGATWFLSERAYIAHRDARAMRARTVALAVVLAIAIALAVVAYITASRAR